MLSAIEDEMKSLSFPLLLLLLLLLLRRRRRRRNLLRIQLLLRLQFQLLLDSAAAAAAFAAESKGSVTSAPSSRKSVKSGNYYLGICMDAHNMSGLLSEMTSFMTMIMIMIVMILIIVQSLLQCRAIAAAHCWAIRNDGCGLLSEIT